MSGADQEWRADEAAAKKAATEAAAAPKLPTVAKETRVTVVGVDVPILDLIALNFKLVIAAIPVAMGVYFVVWLIRSAMAS